MWFNVIQFNVQAENRLTDSCFNRLVVFIMEWIHLNTTNLEGNKAGTHTHTDVQSPPPNTIWKQQRRPASCSHKNRESAHTAGDTHTHRARCAGRTGANGIAALITERRWLIRSFVRDVTELRPDWTDNQPIRTLQ